MFFKYFYTLFFIFVLISSCTDSDDDALSGCGLENPRQDLAWLRKRIAEMANSDSPDVKYCYVVQGTYENNTVFRFEDCNPLIDKAVFTLNCEGERIDENSSALSLMNLENPQIIWRPLNFACEVPF